MDNSVTKSCSPNSYEKLLIYKFQDTFRLNKHSDFVSK